MAADRVGAPSAPREALRAAQSEADGLRAQADQLVKKTLPGRDTKDADYVFLTFVSKHLPHGVIGLLVAVILFAAMSSTASELTALGTTSALDLWQRLRGQPLEGPELLRAGKLATLGWGLVALGFASFASLVDNLIQAVNLMGSLFYGPVLALFLCGFFVPRVRASGALVGALVGQLTVLGLYASTDLGFLWFNFVGCAVGVGVAWVWSVVGPGAGTAVDPHQSAV